MKGVAVFLAIILLFPHGFVRAGIVINEVMYDLDGADTGREWIELYNDGSTPVDISTYKLLEADTNHKFVLFQGDKNIPSLGYAIITSDKLKFKNDWPSFNGIVFDSTFSLSNDGEELVIKDIPNSIKDMDSSIKDTKEIVLDNFIYNSGMGGAGDGKSLQKINGSWVASKPTPGSVNQVFIQPKKVSLQFETTSKNSLKEVAQVASAKNEIEEFSSSSEPLYPPEKMVDKGGEEEGGNLLITSGFLIILISVGCGVVHAIRRNKKTLTSKNTVGEDFEILDY